MQQTLRFTCDLKNGLHARPASMLAAAIRGLECRVHMSKSGGAPVDLRSVLSLVGLDVKHGDECEIIAEGEDADDAIESLRGLISGLAKADEVHPGTGGQVGTTRLPAGLKKINPKHVTGQGVSGGVGEGSAVLFHGLVLCEEACRAKPVSVRHEIDQVRRAIDAVRADLHHRAGLASTKLEQDLLAAHSQIADDPALWNEIERRIKAGATAAQALVASAETFASLLRNAASEYIRDRVIDVQDVAMQVLERLGGLAATAVNITLERESVVFAEAVTANQLLKMERTRLRGLVMGRIGATSHTVILARSLRIPVLIGVPNPATVAAKGEAALVDGDNGLVITAVGPEVQRYYQRRRRAGERIAERLRPLANCAATTTDGRSLEVGANASTAEETAVAIAHGADGVGLLRTETLFLDRDAPPTEQEQFDVYASVVSAAQGRPVIIRTFDVGGDKPAPYLKLPSEENPFLGLRGARVYERHADLLRTQLRAIARASARGPVKVMAPMIALPSEAAWFRGQVRAAQAELEKERVPFDIEMPVGVMIEIPAAALCMDRLCDEVDFFSIGTNDLCQYWMAVDRGSPAVASLYNAHHPSFLRLLRTIVDGARARDTWIGVCGELGGQRANVPLMLGLGVNEISAAPGDAIHLKAIAQQADAARCRELLDAACDARDARAVSELLASGSWRAATSASGSVLRGDMIEIGNDSASKEEAVADAVDLLFIAGRTERPREVEEAVWAREETYSTGLGHGFAVPHCKSDAVSVPSLAVLRLAAPVEWGSMDGVPVNTVILLAIPASDTTGAHMKVFAKLARRLMHESFRDRLTSAGDAAAILRCLSEELEIQ